ncbi:MAG: hypothetical protein FWH26_06210 [Oscillospiraceae bacterium]|nr:hypothetical protein [Oscillospiraceae bacterium]
MLRKFLCGLLAVMAAVVFTGCEATRLGEDPPTTSPPPLTPDIVDQVRDEVGDDDDALQKALRESGFDVDVSGGEINVRPPEGVSVPAGEETTVAPPKPLQDGKEVPASEAYGYAKKALETFQSGVYTLKGRAIISAASGSSGYQSVVVVMDKNRMAYEFVTDWLQTMKDSMGDKQYYGQAAIQAGISETLFGKRQRFIVTPESLVWAFPDRKKYLNFMEMAAQLAAEQGESPDMTEMEAKDMMRELSEALNFNQYGNLQVPRDIKAQETTDEKGNKYLSVKLIKEDGEFVRLSFVGGELKRMEDSVMDGDGKQVISVIEIDEFKPTADESYFSVKGMSPMKITELEKAFGSLSGFFD